jgi:undecaprenyl-diphosphatase
VATELTLRRALLLGALHGPTELLPISSSGHTTAIPWLLGWDYRELDPELRKAFEVALHAGTLAALLIAFRAEVGESLRRLDRRGLIVVGLASAPPGLAGYAYGQRIERHLGTPATVAGALLAGGLALALADRRPQDRRSRDAGARDGLWLGLAQACALVPGVSRNGAALTAGRLLRFRRADAHDLSEQIAVPVISAATLLKTARFLTRAGDQTPRLLLIGTGASFASTLLCADPVRRLARGSSLMPYAAYRVSLATVMIRRLRREGGLKRP